jgi:hypothetical protein
MDDQVGKKKQYYFLFQVVGVKILPMATRHGHGGLLNLIN